MERYNIIKTCENICWHRDCPIQADKYNILLDNVTGKSIIQIKFRNISQKIVKSVSIDIECFDMAKDSLGFINDISYIDVVEPKTSFGDRQPINYGKTNLGNIRIIIDKIVFCDESVWRNKNKEPLAEFTEQKSARECYSDLCEQYERECSERNYKCTCAFENKGGYWICSCGQPNNIANTNCCCCNADINILFDISGKTFLAEQKEKHDENERIKAKKEAAQKTEDEARKKEKNKKIINFALSAIVAIFIISIVCFGMNYGIKLNKYSKANELLESGDYISARNEFLEIADFKDSNKKVWEAIQNLQTKISAGRYHTIGLKSDGMVMSTGNNERGQCDTLTWKDIKLVSAGLTHTVGLKGDGTVVATGNNNGGQCDVSNWKDIIAISAGGGHTVGLKTDGTVVAVGENEERQCDASNWKDIIAISAGANHTVGLKADGTVVAIGENEHDFSRTDLIRIKIDGTVVAAEDDEYGQCDVSDWKDIIAISAGAKHTVGLKPDGTVVAVGSNYSSWTDEYTGQCNVSDWKDIIAISAGEEHTIGLKSDGTVVAVGNNEDGRCNVSDWKDIVAISAGRYHTVGLRLDGTVVAVGANKDGQCNVSDWKDIGK